MFLYITISEDQRGLLFRDGAFKKVLEPGVHLVLQDYWNIRIDVVSVFDYQVAYKDLEQVVCGGSIDDEFIVFDRNDNQSGSIRAGKKSVEGVNSDGREALAGTGTNPVPAR